MFKITLLFLAATSASPTSGHHGQQNSLKSTNPRPVARTYEALFPKGLELSQSCTGFDFKQDIKLDPLSRVPNALQFQWSNFSQISILESHFVGYGKCNTAKFSAETVFYSLRVPVENHKFELKILAIGKPKADPTSFQVCSTYLRSMTADRSDYDRVVRCNSPRSNYKHVADVLPQKLQNEITELKCGDENGHQQTFPADFVLKKAPLSRGLVNGFLPDFDAYVSDNLANNPLLGTGWNTKCAGPKGLWQVLMLDIIWNGKPAFLLINTVATSSSGKMSIDGHQYGSPSLICNILVFYTDNPGGPVTDNTKLFTQKCKPAAK